MSNNRSSFDDRLTIASVSNGVSSDEGDRLGSGKGSFVISIGWSQSCFSWVSAARIAPLRSIPSSFCILSISSLTVCSYSAPCSAVKLT